MCIRIMILGGSGMLGHKLAQRLGDRAELFVTIRKEPPAVERTILSTETLNFLNVDVLDVATVSSTFDRCRPEVAINCIGIVKQAKAAANAVTTMQVNALFPHRLADVCDEIGARLIHLSSDCVFSGRSGGYCESDIPDADDLYGRSKQLGEVIRPGCLTIRTSMIGRELAASHGLLEWFLSHRGGAVDGYTGAVFSGLTTLELARVIQDLVSDHSDLSGLFHVASEPISKFDLLSRINDAMELGITIRPLEQPVIDRSLDGSRFAEATGIRVPSWDKMIADLANDPTPYDDWRRSHGST